MKLKELKEWKAQMKKEAEIMNQFFLNIRKTNRIKSLKYGAKKYERTIRKSG